MAISLSIADLAKRTLRLGSSGQRVALAQERLAAFGFDPGGIDGQFGVYTEEAVRAFQRAYGLRIDGKVGPLTRHVLSQQGVPQTVRMTRATDGGDICSVARLLGVDEENIRTTSNIVGGRALPGEPVVYSMRKLWVRLSAASLESMKVAAPEAMSDRDCMIVPAVSPPSLVESPTNEGIELASVQVGRLRADQLRTDAPRIGLYAAVSDFGPDRTDRGRLRAGQLLRSGAVDDTGGASASYDGFVSVPALCDRIVHKLELSMRSPLVRGVSVDVRMVGAGEAVDYLRFLSRVRRVAGQRRKVVASVPGEWFCRKRVRRRLFRWAVAGFAVEDMLKYVDVVVARCWRDPIISDVQDEPLTPISFARAVISNALRSVPCWRLAAGFMCGAVAQSEWGEVARHGADPDDHTLSRPDPGSESYADSEYMEDLSKRLVMRRRYMPEEDSLKAYLISRRHRGEFWYEDSRTLPRRLALVNRHNLVGVELFWPDLTQPLVEVCRRRFLPLQDFDD